MKLLDAVRKWEAAVAVQLPPRGGGSMARTAGEVGEEGGGQRQSKERAGIVTAAQLA